MAPLRALFPTSMQAATFESLEPMLRRSQHWSPGCEEKSAVPMGIFFLESAHCTARILSSTAPRLHANITSSWTHIDCSIPSLIVLHAGWQQESATCPPRSLVVLSVTHNRINSACRSRARAFCLHIPFVLQTKSGRHRQENCTHLEDDGTI